MSGEVIRLVQGDSKPVIILTLTDDITRGPIDLSAVSTTVQVKFRQAGTTQVLSTINTSKISDGTAGQVQFDFSGGVLDVPPGAYEGEIQINFGGQLQTVYDTIRFRVRENF